MNHPTNEGEDSMPSRTPIADAVRDCIHARQPDHHYPQFVRGTPHQAARLKTSILTPAAIASRDAEAMAPPVFKNRDAIRAWTHYDALREVSAVRYFRRG